MKLVCIGKIVNTFGIKGELKVVPNFELPNKVYKVGNIFNIKSKDYIVTNVRFHKNNYLIELNNLKNINDIEYLKNNDIYFDIDTLNLSDNEYLISELIDYQVIDEENILIGKVTDYDINPSNPLIRVNDDVLIPLKSEILKKVDKHRKIIIIEKIEGLI